MKLRPIELSVTRDKFLTQLDAGPGGSGGKGRGVRPTDLVPDDLKSEIFERDDHCCQFCGFRSEKYQDIHFLNDDYHDHSPDNLVTSCSFCGQCFHIDEVAQMRSGVLVWLPEMPQAVLSHLMRAIYVGRITQGPMADTARAALDMLMKRREEAKARITTDDPSILSLVLKDYLADGHYKERMKKLDGIRLLPLDRRIIHEGDLEFNQFPQILAYWRSKKGPFGGLVPTGWLESYQKLQSGQSAA